MNRFELRQASIDDLEELSILFNEYRIFYKQVSDIEGARQFLFERFEHRESVIFLAVDLKTHQSAGFAQLYPSFSSISMKRIWILNDLYVSEAYRRQGAARQLLDAVKHYAVKTRAKGIGLSTALNNTVAQRLYEWNGYNKDVQFFHYDLML